jgi:hypothetical protein
MLWPEPSRLAQEDCAEDLLELEGCALCQVDWFAEVSPLE